MPNLEVTIIGKTKNKKRKKYYVPDCGSVSYHLRRMNKERGKNDKQHI